MNLGQQNARIILFYGSSYNDLLVENHLDKQITHYLVSKTVSQIAIQLNMIINQFWDYNLRHQKIQKMIFYLVLMMVSMTENHLIRLILYYYLVSEMVIKCIYYIFKEGGRRRLIELEFSGICGMPYGKKLIKL